MRIPTLEVLLLAFGTIAMSACSGDDDASGSGGAGGAHDPAAAACAEADNGGNGVVATAVRDQAPLLAHAKTPYKVTLVSGAPAFVKIASGEDALLFVKTSGVVNGLFSGGAGTKDLLQTPTPNEDCPGKIPQHWDLELEGSTGELYLQLGPAAVSEVWLLLSEAAGHGHR